MAAHSPSRRISFPTTRVVRATGDWGFLWSSGRNGGLVVAVMGGIRSACVDQREVQEVTMKLVNQPSARPSRKVANGAGVGLACGVILVYVVETVIEQKLPAEVAAAVGTITTALASYFIRERAELRVMGLLPTQRRLRRKSTHAEKVVCAPRVGMVAPAGCALRVCPSSWPLASYRSALFLDGSVDWRCAESTRSACDIFGGGHPGGTEGHVVPATRKYAAAAWAELKKGD